MKKLLLVFFLFVPKVYGQTYYSEFSEYKESREFIEESDTTVVSKIDNSKYYKEERFYEDYYIEGQNNPLFPYIDKTMFYTEGFSTYDVPDFALNREISTITLYKYTYMWPIRFLFLYNIKNDVEIESINVYDGEEKIEYFLYKNDSLYFKNIISLKENDFVMIDLKALYFLDDLEVVIDFINEVDQISIKIQNQREIWSNAFVNKNLNNVQGIYSLRFEDFDVVSPVTTSTDFMYEQNTDIKKTTVEETMYEYRVLDYKYAYYDVFKSYVEEESEDTIKEEDVIYQYKTRDKMTIEDDIVIENYHTSLDSFVNATGPYELIGEIDYLKNGEYDVIFRLNDLEVLKKVKVNIEDNVLLEQKEKENIDTIKKLEEKLEENNYAINKKDLNIKTIMKDNIEKVETLNNQVESLDYLLDEKKIDLEVDVKTYDSKRTLMIFILVIILLLLEKIYKEKYN